MQLNIYPEEACSASKIFFVLFFQYEDLRLVSKCDMCIHAKFHRSGSVMKIKKENMISYMFYFLSIFTSKFTCSNNNRHCI